jgi:hypothetical protein
MKKFLREVWVRITLESPSFFVKVQRFFISVLVLAGTCALAVWVLPKDQLPAWIDMEWVKTGLVMGAVGLAVSKLTVKHPEDIHK